MTELAQFEALIRKGEFARVARAISKLNLKKIPRAEAARFANIANRTDQSRLALRLLYPIIRSDLEALTPPSDPERIEYAEALRRTGLLNEAIEIFRDVDTSKHPAVHLNISFCFFNEWRYGQALPHLKELVRATQPEDYLHTIAKVNLAAALVNEDLHDEALQLLGELQEQTQIKGQTLLLGNTLEMTAQVLIRQGRWLQAEQTLKFAEDLFGRDHNKYLFFVRKWQAILGSLRAEAVQEDLLQLRAQALERQDWESARDCDLHIAIISGDANLMRKVYFGTPHSSYRRRLQKMAGEAFSIPESFVWSQSESPERLFDVVKASCEDGSAALGEGSLLHQMMSLLSADFYRPISIGTAFNSLFRGERFGQHGSANRIAQLVARLRKVFAEENLGIEILETNGKYRLHLGPQSGIRVAAEMPQLSRNDLSWMKLKIQLTNAEFTRQDLERISQFSPAKAKRILRWAIDNGQVRSIGFGPNTRYELAA